MSVGDMGSTQSVRIVVCRKGTVDKNMENSKLNDRLKKQKNDKILQFIKENLRYFAAGALFVVMVTVLAMCARPQEGKMPKGDVPAAAQEYEVDAHAEVNTLIQQYYTAYAAGDVATLSTLATPVSANEQSYISMFSQYVDEYQNIKCYTKPGLDEKSYLVSVSMEIKFTGVDTLAPGLDFFYVRTNESGALYIDNLYCQYNLANQENALDTSVQNLIGEFEGQEDVIALQSEVQTRFDEAVAADANLSAMITTTIPDAINGWVTQLAQAQPQPQEPAPEQPQEQPPQEPVPEQPPATEAPQEPAQPQPQEQPPQEMLYAVDTVNVRATADTASEKIGSLEKGVAIARTAVEGEWSKVNYGGYEGYIKSEYLSAEPPAADAAADAGQPADAGAALSEGTEVQLKDTVNIRASMSEDSERIGTAYSGEKVTVIMSYAEGWTKVTWNNKTGYIKSSLLQ